ncbi:hypothetical protein SAY86_009562 [Trapa natans]|uniref:ARID domain-containing protein n=1 Tax=Trapa natans TaxID=22666 RepID=A0AAN7KW76_TRANT|nr:hypothetical protein SAY86_009562 [Trapa natans]
MMFSAQGSYRNHCSLLAVTCGRVSNGTPSPDVSEVQLRYPFPELASSGRLEINVLKNPDVNEFKRILEASHFNFVYLQGLQHEDSEEVSSLILGDVDLSDPEALCSAFGSALPTTVYLEIPNTEKAAEALQSKGVPYVIYWKNVFSRYEMTHFRQALFSIVQSSCSHTWDAFQLAHASFRLYCLENDKACTESRGPRFLGDPPKIDIVQLEAGAQDESVENISSVKIYDDDVNIRVLICGFKHILDAAVLENLEDGIYSLLSIEIRGSRLHNRTSAPPPPLQAGTFSRGVVTMRCDFSTCSSAHISLLVSGSAQTCFNDQLLENHVKNELIENSQLVRVLPSSEESNTSLSEPRKSASIACRANVFEVCMKVPAWASQVLKQLAPDISYRSLVALGIASIQGVPVASFEKEDAERLLFLSSRLSEELGQNNFTLSSCPGWLKPPLPMRNVSEATTSNLTCANGGNNNKRRVADVGPMRPIPCARIKKITPFYGCLPENERHDGVQAKVSHTTVQMKNNFMGPSISHRRLPGNSLQSQQIISLNPLPLKKHSCGRSPIQVCSEEEFLRDVMQFLLLRGHNRLVPQGGLAKFPDVVLNAKRLDLFNLYKEVVSRGGFHVGNGINWKGQVFSKMSNYTLSNRITGVGNTLKRHYETYLLEYELAHEDVGGECCLLCNSSAPGDWVNCGICGEWAHFGCDRRQGLGAFKDYAKTDGLEYICPRCSMSNFRKKSQRTATGID